MNYDSWAPPAAVADNYVCNWKGDIDDANAIEMETNVAIAPVPRKLCMEITE